MTLIFRLPELMLPNIVDFMFNIQQTFFFAFYLVRKKVKHKSLLHGRGLFTSGFGGLRVAVGFLRAACKRSLMAWIETQCRQNYRTTFLAHSSTFRC